MDCINSGGAILAKHKLLLGDRKYENRRDMVGRSRISRQYRPIQEKSNKIKWVMSFTNLYVNLLFKEAVIIWESSNKQKFVVFWLTDKSCGVIRGSGGLCHNKNFHQSLIAA